jgi:beta-glucanase (GH16 family)
MNRRLINGIIALLLLVPFTSLAQVKVLVWYDEFNYTGLPASDKWGYDVGGGGWGNNELQYYTNARAENARVENGNLIIEARKEQYEGSEYTSARLVTRHKGDWLYGRFEAYAKLPSGRGTWPAIWMLPTNWVYGNWPKSGEIDIMEYVGYDPGVVHGSIHTEAYNHVLGTQKTASIPVPDAETAYHLYALEWTPENIDIYVDNNKYFTFANEHKDYKTWPFDQVFHLILNIAVGGNWGGAQGVDPNIWPQKMYVDYVRVYQYIDVSALKISGPEYVSPNQTGVTFTIQNVADATFNWSVPTGTTIVSGQGTNSIVVNWGNTPGNVTVEITHPQAGGTYTRTVKTTIVPTGEKYSVLNIKENGLMGWAGLNTSPNTITLSSIDTLLKVNYSISKPEDFPYFTYTFPNPVDMGNLTVLNVEMMTYNKSKSVVLRADLFDTDGRLTDVSPVFRFYPVEPHGVFHYYSFDFNNNWGSNTPEYGKQVNYHQIAGVRFYVNYGIFGKAATDSLWFSDIILSNTLLTVFSPNVNKTSKFDIYPNPASTHIKINSNTFKENAKIQIINIAGVLVKEATANTEREIPITDLPDGFYSIIIITENNLKLTGSFIKF